MTFDAFDLWVAMITVGALSGLLLGPLGCCVRSRIDEVEEKSNDHYATRDG